MGIHCGFLKQRCAYCTVTSTSVDWGAIFHNCHRLTPTRFWIGVSALVHRCLDATCLVLWIFLCR